MKSEKMRREIFSIPFTSGKMFFALTQEDTAPDRRTRCANTRTAAVFHPGKFLMEKARTFPRHSYRRNITTFACRSQYF